MKIVIAGGGTAGWLSALFLAKQNINREDVLSYDVTVIESDDVPIIGAGEGSTGALGDLLTSTLSGFRNLKGFNEQEFFQKCNTTFKLGIDCIDWNGIGDRFLKPLQPSDTSGWTFDRDFAICSKYGKAEESTPNHFLAEEDLAPVFKDLSSSNLEIGYAYHFDAHKVGKYFKKIALENGIKLQKGTITNTNLNPKNGELQNVILSDGTEIESDFWIDCTGFGRVLSKAVGSEWVSYSEYLPVNKAVVYTHQFEEGESIKPVTTAWAMPNGWMWQIPTQERYGCGYCYSSSFLEPLEATSIHATIVQLVQFTQRHLSPYKHNMMRESNIKDSNEHFNMMLDEFRALIQMHYITKRDDTPFWKYVNNDLKRDALIEKLLEINEYRIPNHDDFPYYKGSAGWGVWCWVLAGNGLIDKEVLEKSLITHNFEKESEYFYKDSIKQFRSYAKNHLPHTEFLEWLKEEIK